MRKFWVIALDVYRKNVKSISFLIMILIPFIMLGIVYLAGFFASQANDINKIGIYSQNTEVAKTLAASKDKEYDFVALSSEKEGEKQLKNEKIDALLSVTISGDQISGELLSTSSLGQSTDLQIQQLLSGLQSSARAQQFGLTAEQVAALSQPAKFEKKKVSFDEGKMKVGDDHGALQFMISFAATIVLFVFIITYAQIIAQEIASEKGTRIMEIILSSTKARTHFYGKLVGVLLVAVTQLLLYGLIFGVSWSKIKEMDFAKSFLEGFSLKGISGSFIVFTILFVILGILLYAILAALCGSLVNKAEDTAKAILPVTYLSLGGYMLGITLGTNDPNNIVVKVTSYIPFLSSYLMPIRLANETVSTAGALMSVAVLVVFTLLLMMISARMYKSNVLIYNANGVFASLKQSLALMRTEKED